MAIVKGRKCDRQGCTTFVIDSENMPNGWIQVMPKLKSGKTEGFEFCSDYCVAYLFMDRYEAATGKRIQRKPLAKRQQEGTIQE